MNHGHPADRTLRSALAALLVAVPVWAADEAAPPAAGSSLQAIVMDVQGKARWRPSSDAEWRDAKVNDIVDPGTEVRTGLKGRVTLRVGKNATVLVDSGTEFQIPQIVQEGETLRTLATVKSGRVDFKVDKVGFSNDFKVVTPATTLSVRGTGFSLASGPLQGVEVSGVRTNMINAIEVKYVASNATYFMSGAAQTSSERQDPVQSAWVSTVGPPPIAGALADKGQLSQQVAQGQAGNAPTNPQAAQQIASAQSNGQGGNAIIVALQDAASSDALRQLALDVTGNSAVLPPKVEPPSSPLRGLLAEELAYVRIEAPFVLADAISLRSIANELSADLRNFPAEVGFENSFDGVYWLPNTETFPELQRVRTDILRQIELADSTEALESLRDMAESPSIEIRPGVTIDLTNAVRTSGEWASLFPRDGQGHFKSGGGRGEDVFETAHRDHTGSSFLDEPGEGGSRDPIPNAVRWLENAQGWSAADRADSEGWAAQVAASVGSRAAWGQARNALERLETAATFWGIDTRGGNGEYSPTMVAVMVNEAVQRSWDGVVSSALGDDVGAEVAARHGEVTGGIARMVDLLESHDLAGIHAGIDNYIAAYKAAALADGSPEARRALEEFLALVNPVREGLNDSLAKAYQSLQESNEARSVSYRVFHLSAANAILRHEFRQAAEIASRCQSATHGADGIVPNSAAIQSATVTAMNQAIQNGVITPDLATAREGDRP